MFQDQRFATPARVMLMLDSMRHADPLLPERRRVQILDAARACFAARGLSQTTIEDICAEARVSPGALYRYFASKAEIVAALAHEAHAEADALIALDDDPATVLDALARNALGQNAMFNVALWAEASHDPPLAGALAQRDARNQTTLSTLVGSVDVARLLIVALDGLAQRRALNHLDFETACSQFSEFAHTLLGVTRPDAAESRTR
ncbi:transcriptional regulator of TetR family [alpha proteobacterium U9-1i]|nr:transcriptional regulator of TetR family [alpha proteobacterium U9-1i]